MAWESLKKTCVLHVCWGRMEVGGLRGSSWGGGSGGENLPNAFHWLCELKSKKVKSFCLDIKEKDSLKLSQKFRANI